jgi:hypothetical protein
MQPKIAYAIHATLSSGSGRVGSRTVLEETREIRLMPFNTVSSPVQIRHLPAAPSSTSVRSLKQNIWASPLGEMKVSVNEPSPLCLHTMAPRASTKCLVRLHFTPKLDFASTVRPESWGCTVRSYLYIKTFYSVRPLPKLPDLLLLQPQAHLRLRSGFTRVETQTTNTLSWRLDRLSRHGTITENSQLPWIAIVTLPITVSKSLLPTFNSMFAARLYTIKMTVKVLGVRHEPFELEVPLQVVYGSSMDKNCLLYEEAIVNERNSVPALNRLDPPLAHLIEEPEVRCEHPYVC